MILYSYFGSGQSNATFVFPSSYALSMIKALLTVTRTARKTVVLFLFIEKKNEQKAH